MIYTFLSKRSKNLTKTKNNDIIIKRRINNSSLYKLPPGEAYLRLQQNEMRTMPTTKLFLGDKKMNDIVYGFFQSHSYINKLDTGEIQRYCWKSDVSAKKIEEYLQQQDTTEKIPTSRTITNVINLFVSAGLLEPISLQGKKAFLLPDLNGGEYIYIKTETLRFLTNTCKANVIKTYSFLKKKYQQHIDLQYTEPYRFSKKNILEILGYSATNGSNYTIVTDILNCLVNNGLIEIHKEWTETGNDNVTEYFVLDKVNDDFIDTINSHKEKENAEIAVIVPNEPVKEGGFVF